MKMKKRNGFIRAAAYTLTALLLLSVLSACGGSNTKDSESSTDGSGSGNTAAETTFAAENGAAAETTAAGGNAANTETPDSAGDDTTSDGSDSGNGTAQGTGDSANSSAAGAADTGHPSAPLIYNYEQPLAIVDDNFRNCYEIFVYSFCDSDGDGIGDLNGVTQKLDYISDMGFNAIWLMPVMQSTTYHKYDVVDYRSIDKEYGTTEDFQNLVEQCHTRGIRVILDFVINHSSSQNRWFTDACEYLRGLPDGADPVPAECPSVEYYHFSREKENDTYYPVSGTDWYYEGSFWSEMPDLNLASAALRTELEDIAAYWIKMGVDGFRMDAALHFEENADDFNTEVLNWLYNYCKSLDDDFYMVSEVWASKTAIAAYYKSGTPSMFNFDAADAEGKLIKAARGSYYAASFVQAMAGYQADFSAANPDYIDAPFITNHDMGRAANALRQDENDLKMACGLLMTMNGTPYVYYGEEIGMSSSGTKDENKRLPMLWTNGTAASADGTNGAAAERTGEATGSADGIASGMTRGPRDADPGITSAFPGVDVQLNDPYSILNYYKRALRIRNENPAIARGSISIIEALTDGHQAAITKTWNGTTIGIIYNTSDEPMAIDLTGTELAEMGIRGYLTVDGSEVTLSGGMLALPGQGICILQ